MKFLIYFTILLNSSLSISCDDTLTLMHAIHHTRAVILKSAPAGEANKRVWLFTEEFGLIVAAVQGVRKPEAKLRGQIPDYAFISADLVRGKEVWRLVNAVLEYEPVRDHLRDPLARSFVRTLATLERFLAGEAPHAELFAHLEECATCLTEGGYDVSAFDTVCIWRTLVLLGYIAVSDEDDSLYTLPLGDAIHATDATIIKRLVREVQQAITETHL